MIPEQVKKFIESFSKLPSVGPRFATRLAFYLLSLDESARKNLESSLVGLGMINRCERCFFLKKIDSKLCDICTTKERDPKIIAIIEKETDLLSIEGTRKFKGHYLLLGELPERGTLESVHRLRLKTLKDRITSELGGKATELVIALNLNTFGDFVASIIKEEFKNLAEKITRIGRGIPTGGEIEFADEETLSSALERRN